MINNILIDGTSVNITGTRWLSAVSGGASPVIEVGSYARSGGDGVALGKTCYRSIVLSFSVTIGVTSLSSLATEKQRFLSLLNADPSSEKTNHKFTFVTANGLSLTTEAAVTAIDQQITPADYTTTTLTVQIATEKPYLAGTKKEVTLNIANLGGMEIPMTIPMAMNLNASTQLYSQLNNAGNAYSHLKATITGPCAGFVLLNQTQGKRWQSTQTLTTTDSLTVDFYQRTILLNNNINVLNTVSGQWWNVAPGINNVLLAANDTTEATSAILEFHDAYLGI